MIEISAFCIILALLIAGAFVRRQRKEGQAGLDRFIARPGQNRIPPCLIRPYVEADFERCLEIHRLLVEAKQIPAGYEEDFATYLRERRALVLVCEAEGSIRGLGGLAINRETEHSVAMLSYGLIHPEEQRQGYGTALLLARLTRLPTVPMGWAVHMSSQGSAPAFYQRFGFREIGSHTDEFQRTFGVYRMGLHAEDQQLCRTILSDASVTLRRCDAPIPVIPLHGAPAAR